MLPADSILPNKSQPCGTRETVAKSDKSAQWVETDSNDIGDSPALLQKMAKKPRAAQLERVRIVASQAGVTQNGVGSTKPANVFNPSCAPFEAHRAILESRSVDRVCNFALEELGRINTNFDPAWMSGKIISCTVSSFSNY